MSQAFPAAVYILCFVTSSACAFLLARNYLRTSTRLLLWSALCFVLLACNNLVLIVDLLLLPEVNLHVLRLAFSLSATLVLLYGFIWNLDD